MMGKIITTYLGPVEALDALHKRQDSNDNPIGEVLPSRLSIIGVTAYDSWVVRLTDRETGEVSWL